MENYKKCAKCGEYKLHNHFNSCKKTRDKLQSYCRECQSLIFKQNHIYAIKKKEAPDGYKKCTRCKEVKSIDNFNKHNKGSLDGLDCYCRLCRSEINLLRCPPTGNPKGIKKGTKAPRKNPITGLNIHYDEQFIIDWVDGIKDKGLYVPYNVKKSLTKVSGYKNVRSFMSSVGLKLDDESKKIFVYHYKKQIDNDPFECCNCGGTIDRQHFMDTFNSYSQTTSWCKKCYDSKAWIDINRVKGYTPEANKKRSENLYKFFQSEEGTIAKQKIGSKNKINTKRWQESLTKDQKQQISEKSSKAQLLNVLNGFDPQKNYAHFKKNTCYVNGTEYIFRSSWEVVFFISHSSLKYETIRIPYTKSDSSNGIYIPDFIDEYNKIIYELKPRRNYIKQQHKMDAGIEWCLNNGYRFIWINENNIWEYVNEYDNNDERNNIFYIKTKNGTNHS